MEVHRRGPEIPAIAPNGPDPLVSRGTQARGTQQLLVMDTLLYGPVG
jgi:hypothetical protein